MKVLASKLNNRMEVWKNQQIDTELGVSIKPICYRKIWGDIVPQSGNLNQGEANTEYNNTRFKITIRRIEIETTDWFVFKGKTYNIDYILPDYNTNKYMQVYVTLKTE